MSEFFNSISKKKESNCTIMKYEKENLNNSINNIFHTNSNPVR